MGEHTLPDYTTKYKMTKIFASIDNNELAARLGSVDTYDRRGNIILIDDFEASTLKWTPYGIAARGSVVLNTTEARNGDQSVQCVTGNVDDDEAGISKYVPYLIGSRMGLECSIFMALNMDYYIVQLHRYDGTNVYDMELKIDRTNELLQIYRHPGVYQTIKDNIILYNYNNLFHTIKIVGDFVTGKYVRLMVDDTEYDISAYNLYHTGNPIGPSVLPRIYGRTESNNARTFYIDDVIVTQTET